MRLLIVGAGPCGTALALLLTRRGFDVMVLEQEDRFDRVFRGEALMPGGVDAIAQMGLRDAFERLPHRRVECMEFFVDGTRILRADWPELSGVNAAHLVSQPALLEMFVDAARRHPHFELRMGTRVRDLKVTPTGVELQVESSAGQETVSGDAVIGTDGRASLVRARVDQKVERLPFPWDVVWFSTPLPPEQLDDPRFQAFSRAGQSAALYPSWDDRLRVGVNVPAHEASRLHAVPKAQLIEGVGRVVGEPYASFFRQRAADISEPVILKVLFGRCPRWSGSRTLLLGDAAHPMSPVRAQGINLALRDAIVAANHLVPALASTDADAFECATQRIQQEREPEIVESQRLQVLSAQPPPPARSAMLRATVLPVLRQLGLAKRLFLKTELPMRHGIVPVRLSV